MTRSVCVLGDDRHLAMLVSSAIQSKGLEVRTLSSGRQALGETGSQDRPELYVVGEELEDLDGIEFISKLRSAGDETPVVFVSKNFRERDFYKMMRDDLHVQLVAHRPLKTQVFGVQLRHLLNGAQQQEIASRETITAGGASGPVFDRLRSRFISSLPTRLGKIEQFLEPAKDGIFNRTNLELALTAAHNLKGTSLSWSFEDLGNAAERMESILRQIVNQPQDREALSEDARSLYESLKEAVAECVCKHEDEFGKERTNLDLSKAHVLLISSTPDETFTALSKDDIGIEFVTVPLEEAIARASCWTLDACVIDMNAGSRSDCLAIARSLRDVPGCENLPLAFLSKDDPGDRAETSQVGGSLFLRRPIEASSLAESVGRLIAMREGGRFRVLVVDDDEDLAALTCGNLAHFGILTRAVNDPLQVDAALGEFNPDMVLLDIHMPALSGFEICRSIRRSPRWRDLPILFLTAQTDLASRLTAYESGGDDYLPKPVIQAELLTRVKVRLERSRELKERSERDLLTGLALRRAFCTQIDSLMARENARFSLAIIDLDRFKNINDTYGHQAGDEVLSSFGRLLRRRFRVEDLRSRWGGEEFILAFMNEGRHVLKKAMERVMEEFRNETFTGEQGQQFNVTFSCGVADYPEEGNTLKQLLQVADRRLYLAKANGRMRIETEG